MKVNRVSIFIIFAILLFMFLSISEGINEEKTQEDIGLGKLYNKAIYMMLDDVCEIALSNNFDIQLAQFDAQLKAADLDDARSIYDTIVEVEAKYKDDELKSASTLSGTKAKMHNYDFGISRKLPTGTTLELDFENERSWTDSTTATVNPAHESLLKLTLKQELGKNFFGIEDRSNIKITKIDIENAEYTSLDKIEESLSQVQKTYWEIVKHLNIVKIRKDMVLYAQELFQINEEKIQKGIIESPQLLSSQANLRQKEIDLILAENDLYYYINKLKLLLNIQDKNKIILPKQEFDINVSKLDLDKTLRTAFYYRRDYSKARNEVESKRINLVMKKTSLFPEIDLEASVARNGLDDHFSQAINDITSEDNPEYFLGLKIRFPLENRQAKSEFNKAKIEDAKALLNLKKVEYQILIDIKDSVRNSNILGESLKRWLDVVKLQEDKLSAELKHYQYGRSDTDTIIKYQDDLLNSKILYTKAMLDYKESLIDVVSKQNLLLDNYWEKVL